MEKTDKAIKELCKELNYPLVELTPIKYEKNMIKKSIIKEVRRHPELIKKDGTINCTRLSRLTGMQKTQLRGFLEGDKDLCCASADKILNAVQVLNVVLITKRRNGRD